MEPEPGPLCDAHIHLFATGFAGRSGRSPAGDDDVLAYDRLRERHSIDLALVIGYEGDTGYRGNNDFILAQRTARPWLRPLAYVDPTTNAVRVATALAAGFCGVSVYATDAGAAAEFGVLLDRMAPALADRRALLSVNVIPSLYPVIEGASERWPDLRILISHLGLPAAGGRGPGAARAALRDLGRLGGPNVYIKASGFYALGSTVAAQDAMAAVLDAVGSHRVIWGSDFPPVLDHSTFVGAVAGDWRRALPTDAVPDVMGGTLRQLLGEVEG